ncbi:hypothetical protein T4A_8338 [Trichinella pseudospiralis]|uniref:Uncharacterized protein n=1 Tax=Trichinella pseudospiralis TaxID=6337 RepID=A0A0V1DPY9_TRIPS|nr:hypothetical protein T4A_13184 [Trichinella pseudospiralis]KRY63541.1 hypothetical protein T4A_8338 [Trichinella pseudospiralis]
MLTADHPLHKNDAQSSEESGCGPSESFKDFLVQNRCRTLWRVDNGQRCNRKLQRTTQNVEKFVH